MRVQAAGFEPEIPEDMQKGPDGRELTEAQRAAVRKVMRDHERNKARKTALYDGFVGKLYAFVQSCQTCYIVIMVIVGASFVWSTFPSDLCVDAEPQCVKLHPLYPFLVVRSCSV